MMKGIHHVQMKGCMKGVMKGGVDEGGKSLGMKGGFMIPFIHSFGLGLGSPDDDALVLPASLKGVVRGVPNGEDVGRQLPNWDILVLPHHAQVIQTRNVFIRIHRHQNIPSISLKKETGVIQGGVSGASGGCGRISTHIDLVLIIPESQVM